MKIHVYTDESRIKGERFMLIGGLWVPEPSEAQLRGEIAAVRATFNATAEFKWTKVSNFKLPAYSELVNAFFKCPDVSFHCIVVDVTILDYARFHRSDTELGFYKFYYQLLSRKLQFGNAYFVYTDERRNRKANRLAALQIITNRYWGKFKQAGTKPVRTVEPRDSKREDILQLADVLLGATGYAWNSLSSSPAKLKLIGHIESKLGRTVTTFCLPGTPKFNVWHWKPSATSLARTKKKTP
jgi:hypothetical protein